MNTTAKTLSALLLGAALATPALAQDATSANNGNSATAQTAGQAVPSAAPTMPVDSSTSTNTAMNTAASQPAGTQMAMNSTGNASDLSSVPDTSKKYKASSRGKDFQKEAEVTKQLNQKESSLNGASAQ